MSDTAKQFRNEWREKTNFLLNHAAQKRIPLSGVFEITARCNLSCHMCYIRHDGTKEVLKAEKSTREWIDMGAQAAKAGTLFLLITGGEPLIRKDFREIYEALNKMGFHLILFTNATLIDEDFIKWISPIRPNKVGVTLYGASPETYQKVTGNAEGFYKTLNGLDLLLQEGITVELRNALTQGNVHEMDKIDEIAESRGFHLKHSYTLFKPVRGGKSGAEKVRLSPQQIKEISLKKLNIEPETQYPYDISHDAIDNEPKTYHDHDNTNAKHKNYEAMNCMAGKSSYLISWDGKMAPCGLMQEPYTKPFSLGFQNAWEKLVGKIPAVEAPEECNNCKYWPYCTVCPAKLQAETGSFKKLSPYICEMAKMKNQLFFQQTKSKIT